MEHQKIQHKHLHRYCIQKIKYMQALDLMKEKSENNLNLLKNI